MEYTEYRDPRAFLGVTRRVLEEHEALHGLMLGVSLRLLVNPRHYGTQPLLATVAQAGRLELIALMTPPHKLQIASFGPSPFPAIDLLADRLHEEGRHIPAVLAQESVARRFASAWNRLSGTRSEIGMRQRVHELRAVAYRGNSCGSCRQATMADADCISEWVRAFHDGVYGHPGTEAAGMLARDAIEGGNLYLWEDPEPVAMAGFTRPTTHGISISLVYTPPGQRRKGYASALVAFLSQAALNSGRRFCTLYTDLANPTSNSIYRRIGYRAVADVMDVHFVADIGSGTGLFSELYSCSNRQALDWDGLPGRTLSNSRIPLPGEPGYDAMLADLRRLFQVHRNR